MREKTAYVVLVVSAILGCLFAWKEILCSAVISRVIGIISIGYVYYLYKEFRYKLFYLALIFAALGESLVVLGMENFKLEISTAFSIYYWLLFFVVKRNVRSIKFWSIIKLYIPGIITAVLVLYLMFSGFNMVKAGYGDKAYVVFFSIFSFLILISYMGLIYVHKRTTRNFWLLPAIVSFVIAQFVLPMEAFYFNSIYFKCFGFLIQVARHYFVLKFLISPEDEIVLSDKKYFL
ncbi:hypothetical protein [Aquimarina agarivorans]|uniref:hypothetical protein n=1 Tax=Aquimarina agarivorans TaxID=980584 RepID=UPI000248FD43|nr:hypothetical protein [Aquimarina agarivorans]